MTEWTKTPPTEIGHYWWRSSASMQLWDYEVIFIDHNLRSEALARVGRLVYVPVENMPGEWWPKPIRVPK